MAIKLDNLENIATIIKSKYGDNYVGLTKDAAVNIADSLKLAISLTVLFGVPLGIGLHRLDAATSPKRIREKELQEKIKFYKGLTTNIESTLADDAKLKQTQPQEV